MTGYKISQNRYNELMASGYECFVSPSQGCFVRTDNIADVADTRLYRTGDVPVYIPQDAFVKTVSNGDLQQMIQVALDNWDFTDFPETKASLEGMKNAEFEQYEIDEHVKSIEDWDGLNEWADALS